MIINVIEELKVQKVATLSGVIVTVAAERSGGQLQVGVKPDSSPNPR